MRSTACALLLTLLAATGCSTCASPHDRSYAADGGLWQRTDACEGRVGSAFTQSGVRLTDGELLEEPWLDEPLPGGDEAFLSDEMP